MYIDKLDEMIDAAVWGLQGIQKKFKQTTNENKDLQRGIQRLENNNVELKRGIKELRKECYDLKRRMQQLENDNVNNDNDYLNKMKN